MQVFRFFIALIYIVLTMNSTQALKLTAQAEIKDATYLRKVLFSTYEKIGQCQANGNSNKLCNCEYKRYFTYLNLLENEFYRKYSHLKNASELNYTENQKPKFLMLGEYSKRIKFKFSCDQNLY